MKRMLCVALVAFAIADTASAASLIVVSDKTTYYPGETVTLTVAGSDAGATAYGIQGRLEYNEAFVDAGTRTQISMGSGWVKGPLGTGPGFSWAFSQIFGIAGVAASAPNLSDVSLTPFSTVTLIAAQTFGVVNVSWNIATDSGFELMFFGLTNAPGTSFTIIPCDGCPVIPEPATGALFGLGMLLLGALRRPGHT